MQVLKMIEDFAKAHTDILVEIEKLSIDESVTLLKQFYPGNTIFLAVVEKLAAEIKRLQGIQ